MFSTIRKYSIFFIIPGLVLGFSILLKLASGPYWLAPNFDPSYQYLVNGLYLIKGLVPNHSDHPGTPLQILCGVIYCLFNPGRPMEEVVKQVLIRPEFYLHLVFMAIAVFSFVTSLILAVYVFRKTNDVLAAVLTQLPALTFLVLKSGESLEPVLPVVANVSPEPLLIGVLNLFNICLFMHYFSQTSKQRVVSAFWGGLVGGLGAAIKLTFVPVLLIPLIILSWKERLLFIIVFAASFVCWTLPIISKYPIIWGWISGIALHRSAYGSGGGAGGILTYCLNCKNIIFDQWVFTSILGASIALVIWTLVKHQWDKGTFFLAATLLGILFQFSVVTQHPGAHYLLPGMGLFSVLLVFFYLQGMSRHVLGRRIALVFILIGTLAGIWQAAEYRLKLAGLTRDILTFHDEVSAKYSNCITIDYYRSSDQQAALFFGDGWNLSPHLGKELFELYPHSYYLQIWGDRILSFNGQVWSNDLLAQNSCVLFQGDGKFDFSQGPYEVQLLEKGRFESIHLLTGTSEKQAALLISGAMRFYQTGDYQKALMCVLEAQKLHYQPESTVESLLQLIKPDIQH